MNNLRERLIKAHESNRIIVAEALEFSYGSDENHSQVIEALITLHNERAVNIIKEFKNLKNIQGSSPDFFPARRLLEKSLPQLNAPLCNVMECIERLVKEAGQDMLAHSIFSPFIEFCAVDVARPVEGLKLIEESPELWASFVSPIIIAGSRLDLRRFFDKALVLTSHDNIDVRRNAIFSLGRIEFKQSPELPVLALKQLEYLVRKETDDLLFGNIVSSVCSIFRQVKSQADHVVKILEATLSKGQDYTLHAASQEFHQKSDELTESMLQVIMRNLIRINPKNNGTINNIDYGLAALIKGDSQNQTIEFLEKLLLSHQRELSLKLFNSVIHEILTQNILEKLLTRWFLRGNPVLCHGIRTVLSKVHGEELHLKIDQEELPASNSIILMYLAKKIIGYLFFKPITAASIIVSLIQYTHEPDTAEHLASLLFDPLLINYSGSVNEYLKACIKNEEGQKKEVIQKILDDFETYFEGLKSVGKIPEMYPSQGQREAYARHLNQQMNESYKEAMKGSWVNLIFSKSVLLYGRKSINYIDHGSGEAKRMEIPMKKHGTEMEFPRREHIDPFGLDYMLRLFRAERLVRS